MTQSIEREEEEEEVRKVRRALKEPWLVGALYCCLLFCEQWKVPAAQNNGSSIVRSFQGDVVVVKASDLTSLVTTII